MSEIWITGCTGFIGSNLSALLASDGHTLRLFHRSTHDTSPSLKTCTFVPYSNSSLKSTLVKSLSYGYPSSIFHLSGCSSVDAAESDTSSLVDLVDSTSIICDFIINRTPSSSIVLLSSPSVLGKSQSRTDSRRPISYYALQKLAAENIVEYYSRVHNLNSIIARTFSCYGKGLKKQILWDACHKLLRPNPVFRGSGRELRDFIHISDVVSILSLFVSDNWNSGVYNIDIGTCNPVSISSVVESCASSLSKFGLDPFDWTFIDREDNRAPSVMRAENVSAWIPSYSSFVPIAQGIDSYVEWFVDNGLIS